MSIANKETFNKRILDYLFTEVTQTVMGMFVFLVIIAGLLFTNIIEHNNFLLDILFYSLVGLVSVLMIYVCVFEFYKLNIYKKMLKNESYSIEDCISRNVTMKMNRARKEIELVAKYENNVGELSDKEFTVLSDKKVLTVPDCEGKECKYVRFTDNFGFIYVE